jgi:hypothetical protein
MKSATESGGDLILLPLKEFVRPGKGDDVTVVVDHEELSHYGCLNIEWYREDFALANDLATGEGLNYDCPVMVAIEDPESGSPMVLTRRVRRNGKDYFLAVIFNAAFSLPDENRPGSFCLRMTSGIDPNRVFSERIMYSPGENITWEPDQLAMLELDS